jgi:hypothetical protein
MRLRRDPMPAGLQHVVRRLRLLPDVLRAVLAGLLRRSEQARPWRVASGNAGRAVVTLVA